MDDKKHLHEPSDEELRVEAAKVDDGGYLARMTEKQIKQRSQLRKIKEKKADQNNRILGDTRGGAREGAGRPLVHGEKATVNVAFRLTPSEKKALLETFSKDGKDSVAKICQRLARQALK